MIVSRSFPSAYLLLWFPAVLLGHLGLRVGIAVAAILVSIAIGNPIVRRFVPLFGLALLLYALLSAIVNGASCSARGIPLDPTIIPCIFSGAGPSVALIAALLSTVLLAIGNEWRASLVKTVNSLTLPRDVKIVCAIAGSLLGEFRRASLRVHHATTAQGEASPKRSFRNLTALPRLAAATWASVLSAAVLRLRHQWASDAFWDHYFPRDCAQLRSSIREAKWDVTILAIGIASLGWAIFATIAKLS